MILKRTHNNRRAGQQSIFVGVRIGEWRPRRYEEAPAFS
jgi:hypothetical protein